MEESIFIKWIQQFFRGITNQVVVTLNDTTRPLTYLHTTMLRPVFSVSGKWESVSASNTLVMADIVAMDSPLPLKKRDAIARASGDIPKMGIGYQMNEKQLTELDTLAAMQVDNAVLVQRIFADVPKSIAGVFERNEAMFLEGLSTGVTEVLDDENVGVAIRVDYGYKASHKFGVDTLWSDVASKPFDDIERMQDQARLDGNNITIIMADRATIRNAAKTTQAKQLYAFDAGFTGTAIPTPNLAQLNNMTQTRFGFVFQEIDRQVRYEKNGTQTVVTPWKAGNIIGTNTTQVGELVYARLAEQNHPVAGVAYANPTAYILTSMYRQHKPSLSEHTDAQARVVPVISAVEQIYMMETTVLEA